VISVPAKNPRVNVVLERPLYQTVRRWARRDGVSLSTKVRDVVKAAVELEEDRILTELADTREQSFDREKALTHSEVWGRLRRSRR
jgi:plasmid stability protein